MPLRSGANFGPYRVIDQLGKGGMASVYRAYEAGLDRYVALNVLPAEFLHDDAFAARFTREAKVIAREHPGMIAATGADMSRFRWYAVVSLEARAVAALLLVVDRRSLLAVANARGPR